MNNNKKTQQYFQAVAWGAIGLDYSDKFGRTDHELQRSVFRRQCELAVKHKLPIVIQEWKQF